jgi:hypothetical protein
MSLPLHALRRARGGKGHKAKRAVKKQLQVLLQRLRNRDDAALFGFAKGRAEPTMEPQKSTALERQLLRAKELALDGYISKAAKALFQNPTRDPRHHPSIISDLQALHPPGPHPSALPSLPPDAPFVQVPADKNFQSHLVGIDGGQGTSISQQSRNQIAVLVYNDICLAGLAALITDIINGVLGTKSKRLLLTFVLMGPDKDGGGIRPLAMGETAYIAAASWVVGGAKVAIGKALGPIQLGVGVQGGAEVAAQLINALLCAEDEDEIASLAGLACDFRNAFNTIDRAHVLKELFKRKELSMLWRISHWAYSTPSSLWIKAGNGEVIARLLSTQGVRQGDPLGSTLFAVGVHSVYMETLANQDAVGAVAIHDDLTLIGPPDCLPNLFERLKAAGAKVGLVLVPKKSHFLWYHDAPLPATVNDFLTRNPTLKLNRTATKLLGCPIGNDQEAIIGILNSIIDKHVPFFHAITRVDILGSQIATLLLAYSGHPRLNYLIRAMDPQIAMGCFARFDELVMNTAVQITSSPEILNSPSHVAPHPTRHIAPELFVLPMRLGGMGFRQMSVICIAAFIASLAQAAPFLAHWKQGHTTVVLHNARLRNTVSNCLTNLRTLSNAPAAPITANTPKHPLNSLLPPNNTLLTLLESFSTDGELRPVSIQMQHNLTRFIENAAFQKLKPSLPPMLHNHLIACKAQWSSAWLRATPDSHSLRLSDIQFRIAWRLRLSLVPLLPPSAPCFGCDKLLTTDPFHPSHCPVGSSELTLRHDGVNQAVAAEARAMGAATHIEPQSILFPDNRHPDLSVVAANLETLLDVTIRDPLAPSYTRLAATSLGVAKAAEKEKVALYAQYIEGQGAVFVPFAIESLGGWGPSATNFARMMALHAEENLGIPKGKALLKFVRTISVAVQRGNARLWLGSLQKARAGQIH